MDTSRKSTKKVHEPIEYVQKLTFGESLDKNLSKPMQISHSAAGAVGGSYAAAAVTAAAAGPSRSPTAADDAAAADASDGVTSWS